MSHHQVMTSRPLIRQILYRRFRANRCFALVAHESLSASQRLRFSGLAADPSHFGLLVPTSHPELGVLAVDRHTADLFQDLKAPGRLPLKEYSDEMNLRFARLVLDGVLELEFEGRFVTGPHAHAGIFTCPLAPPRPQHRVARLSIEALRWAQGIETDDPQRLCSWLYAFHTAPVGPRWVRRFATWEKVQSALGFDPSSKRRLNLDQHYIGSQVSGWMSWRLREMRTQYEDPISHPPAFKLYVSPHPSALAEALAACLDCILQRRPPAFKMGRDVYGLMRPDKLMVYFDQRPELERFAEDLQVRLDGCRAHGVPFTAALDPDGLVSWGIDPPLSERIPDWRGSESWRVWLAERLARALHRARALAEGQTQPWLCALDRIRLEGVDPDTWLPNQAIWHHKEVA